MLQITPVMQYPCTCHVCLGMLFHDRNSSLDTSAWYAGTEDQSKPCSLSLRRRRKVAADRVRRGSNTSERSARQESRRFILPRQCMNDPHHCLYSLGQQVSGEDSALPGRPSEYFWTRRVLRCSSAALLSISNTSSHPIIKVVYKNAIHTTQDQPAA